MTEAELTAIEARSNAATPSRAEFRATPGGGMEVLHCRMCGGWEHVPIGAAREIGYLRSRLAEFHCPECGSSMGSDHSFDCAIGRRDMAAAGAEALWREAHPEAMLALVNGTAAVVPLSVQAILLHRYAGILPEDWVDLISSTRIDKPVSL